MKLLPLESEHIPLAAHWLAQPENHNWLDFGGDVRVLTPTSLRAMTMRPVHCLRLFTSSDDESVPAGLVAFSNVSQSAGTAMLWYLLGDKQKAARGLTTRAVRIMLRYGFLQLGLQSIDAWVAEGNQESTRILTRNGFRMIGVRRRCHRLPDRVVDRTLFDLLKSEFLTYDQYHSD